MYALAQLCYYIYIELRLQKKNIAVCYFSWKKTSFLLHKGHVEHLHFPQVEAVDKLTLEIQ